MFRIDHTTAVAVMPAPGTPGTPGFFTEGDPVGGIPATVVTQAWANAIQEEIVSVILSAGLSLNKTTNAQLLAAIQGMIAASEPPAASETVAGVLQIATTAIAQAMLNETMAVTPKRLADALRLRVGHTFTGSDWTPIAGGLLILQWGSTGAISAGGSKAVTLPIAYPSAHMVAFAIESGASASTASADIATGLKTLTGFNILSRNSIGSTSVDWFSLGF